MYFCLSSCSEENVWKLCERIKEEKIDDLNDFSVVFISNNERKVRFIINFHLSYSDCPTIPISLGFQILLENPESRPIYAIGIGKIPILTS